jgi:tetratricopeptide (TPR) repeat protein
VPRYRRGVVRARLYLGEILWATGRRTEAWEQFRQARSLADQLNPKDPVDQSLFAMFLANSADLHFRDPGKAVELAKAVVSLAPRVADSWMILGAAHYRAGDYRAAALALGRAQEADGVMAPTRTAGTRRTPPGVALDLVFAAELPWAGRASAEDWSLALARLERHPG